MKLTKVTVEEKMAELIERQNDFEKNLSILVEKVLERDKKIVGLEKKILEEREYLLTQIQARDAIVKELLDKIGAIKNLMSNMKNNNSAGATGGGAGAGFEELDIKYLAKLVSQRLKNIKK